MKKSIIIIMSLLIHDAYASYYCPEAVNCVGYTSDTCVAKDPNWYAGGPVMTQTIEPGVYSFIYAIDYHSRLGSACYYQYPPTHQIVLYPFISLQAQISADSFWQKDGYRERCFSPKNAWRCPFVLKNKT